MKIRFKKKFVRFMNFLDIVMQITDKLSRTYRVASEINGESYSHKAGHFIGQVISLWPTDIWIWVARRRIAFATVK